MNLSNLDKPPPVRIFLDSRNAVQYENGRTDQPFFAFPTPIQCPNHYDMNITLEQLTVPCSWYSVNASNNQFKFSYEETDGATLITSTVTLTVGNYSGKQLATEVETKMNAVSGVSGYSVTYDFKTNKFTIANATAYAHIIQFDNLNNPFELLGFVENATYTDKPLTSVNVADLTGGRHSIVVKSNIIQQGTISSLHHNSNILARVGVDVPNSNILTYHNTQHIGCRIRGNPYIPNLLIKLFDERETEIDLNGLHFQCMILITFTPIGISTPNYINKLPATHPMYQTYLQYAQAVAPPTANFDGQFFAYKKEPTFYNGSA